MEKTLIIDGREVRFKSTAATTRRYRAQFGSDFFADIIKLIPIIENVEADSFKNLDYEALQRLDFEVFENIIWVLAKTADPSIPEPLEWLDQFDEMPLMEVLPELQDLLTASFQGKKNANHPALKK